MPRLLIFDASNYMFRAHFASPPMNNSAGFPTNALHFYTSMILSVIRRVSPDAIALACEKRGPKFRHELYPDYKGHRETPPEALQLQFPWFHRITDALGIPAYTADGYEADDIIATLVRQARQKDWHVVIASSDKDLMQLIERTEEGTDAVVMLDAMAKGAKSFHVSTLDDVKSRFNVAPNLVPDVLALAGDTADNIPGCKGIGEKTAGKLIAQYGSLENLMTHLHEIKKTAQKANLEAFAPSAELSKTLTSLVSNVPVELKLETLHPDPAKVIPLFSALELHKLLADVLGSDVRPDYSIPRVQLPGAHPEPTQPLQKSLFDGCSCGCLENNDKSAAPNSIETHIDPPQKLRNFIETTVVQQIEDLDAFLADASAHTHQVAIAPVWLDETLAARKPLGLALASSEKAIYLPLHQSRTLFDTSAESCIPISHVLTFLKQTTLRKCVYGFKPIWQYAQKHGLELNTDSFFDVEIAAYLHHPERTKYDLAVCAEEYLGEPLLKSPGNWLGTGKKALKPETLSPQEIAPIAGLWAQIILQLAEKLPAILERHRLKTIYETQDLPLSRILAQMEFYGIRLDISALTELTKAFDAEMTRLDKAAHSFSDVPFNINSPKDLGRFLFDVLGLVPGTKKNRQHGMSTDQETLESIEHPIAQIILDYRAISKLRSTYTHALADMVNPATGRLHGQFNACVTATTRLSSSDPNLQNIPSRTELGRQIRRAFIPQNDWTFVSADYSQIELRLMAAFSQEPVLCQAYQNGEDVHRRTAAALLDIPLNDVTKEQRQLAKTINFGLLYGMGVHKLARETGTTKAEAKAFLEKFHAQFPTLSSFFEKQIEKAHEAGETRTLDGHRRPLIPSRRPMEKALNDRIALNTPIQGSASDIVKRAMLRLDKMLHEQGLHARLLLQVHDELLLECPDDEVDQVANLLTKAMENAADIGVPLRVELKIGKTWADMAPIQSSGLNTEP